MDYKNEIKNYIELEKEILDKLDIDEINKAINLIVDTKDNDGNIYIFGNGGSSATASHIVNDFNKGISEYIDKKFNFICLTDNFSSVMAIANDIGFEEIFRFQLKNKLKENDILIGISGSGNSKNVLNAVEYGKEMGLKVIGFTGYDGGKLYELSDIHLHVPVNSMQITEDIHMVFDHLMMSILYKSLCNINHLKG